MSATVTTTPAPTFDDVWRALMEMRQQMQESQAKTDQQMQETDRRMQETDRRMQETNKQIQETSEQLRESQAKTDQQLRESQAKTDQQLRESQAKTDQQLRETNEQLRETNEQLRETEKIVKQVSKQIGELGGRLGEFVEEMVKPAAVRLFQDRGLDVHQVAKNLTAYDDHGQFESEIDLLVVNNATAIAIECKSKLSIDDVKEHLERLQKFKQNFSQYEHYQLLGAVAAMVIPDEVGRYAYQKGLFVMAQSGHAMLIKNDGKFTPKMW